MKTISEGQDKKSKSTLHYSRLFKILCELLEDPGPYKIADTAAHYGVGVRTIQRDLQKLIQFLNEHAKREYITREKGVYEGNFPRAALNLELEEMMYLFLALQQVKPILAGVGSAVYNRLMSAVNTLLSKEEREKFEVWSECYQVREFGFPLKRDDYYQSLHRIFEAIRKNLLIKFWFRGEERYLDPYHIHFTKSNFYVVGDHFDSPTEQKKRFLLHYRLDRLRKVEALPFVRSQLYKRLKDAYAYKKQKANQYLNKMLGAESHGEPKDYLIEILDEEVYRRMTEKCWHKIINPSKDQFCGLLKIPQISSQVEMKKWVLEWGADIRVLEPADFRKKIKQEIEKMLELY
ncbi:Predicted DNA-binding transcriptional regulator YafY, contains an HTH and WYL domains [Seinonella peptonophila]|uniref:Predicted DNA-binding transcriptional regulator YafY, contains an HTH and WYL domains n=1 Tax=Seinonella peptonophila TaxID=112248 RepID=A0A1M5B568_9BACL|nr:WYL domain-containing protein [Seinonella peptonophila]SHF37664.1 Predicted DNA-binding transcriptional regulator YafY, contains an HTH and WYL domains [Seinonella peptonophila]